jgi:hypothetical protein
MDIHWAPILTASTSYLHMKRFLHDFFYGFTVSQKKIMDSHGILRTRPFLCLLGK